MISKLLKGLLLLLCAHTHIGQAQITSKKINLDEILGSAGIARSQFMNGALGAKENYPNTDSFLQAERWYEQAAEQGHNSALGNLAILKYCGDKRPLDMQRAISLLREQTKVASSEEGAATAPWLIGIAYFFGDAVDQNYAQSVPWLELAGRRGNPYAVELLLKIYAEGLTEKPSEKKVLWWLRFAANHGNKDAQIRLAILLTEKGNSPDQIIAGYYWYLSAQQDGAEVNQEKILAAEQLIDPQTATAIKNRINSEGRYKWASWDSNSEIGAYTFPCLRHEENALLTQLRTQKSLWIAKKNTPD